MHVIFNDWGFHNIIFICNNFNHLNAELNPICHLLALLGAHHILHVSRIRVNIQKYKYFQFPFAINTNGYSTMLT